MAKEKEEKEKAEKAKEAPAADADEEKGILIFKKILKKVIIFNSKSVSFHSH